MTLTMLGVMLVLGGLGMLVVAAFQHVHVDELEKQPTEG